MPAPAEPAVPSIVSGDRRITAPELQARALRAAEGFRRLGINEGDTIALFLRNDFAFFEASLGASFAGAYPVPINWHSTADEAGYVLRDSGARALVAHRDLAGRIADAIPDGVALLLVDTPPEIAAAYGVSDTGSDLAGSDWDSWVDGHAPIEKPVAAGRAAVIYTSGTTGKPKGVKRQADSGPPRAPGLAAFGLDKPGPIRVLMNGPMYHSAPNAYGRAALGGGASLVLQARFEAEEMLALIERHRITHMHIVPTMFVRLLRLPEEVRNRYDLSSLRFVIHGAAPCPVEVKQAMIAWWGPVIYEYYGSTETGLAAWHDSVDALAKPGTVGRALPNATIRIYDDEGRELGPNAVGDVYIASTELPDFTYIGQDDKRREIARGDMVTVGDVGWIDEDGFLFLGDRKRDMIISGGVNIYPAEIEAAILGLPGVKDCAVFGIPDDEFGESICAYVEPMDGQVLQPADVLDPLGRTLSRYKLPRTLRFVETLPREDSGKIFKRKLREPYWADRAPARP